MHRIWIYACKRHGHASNQGLHVFMFMHIRCIVGRASCSLVAMLGNLSRPWTTASDQHEAKQARMYDNITMKPTQASKAKYACIYVCHVALRQFPRAKLDQHTSQRRRRVLQQRQRLFLLLLHHHRLSKPSELRPPRPPDLVAMMIAVKNGATTTATTVMTTGQKARGPDNFIATD